MREYTFVLQKIIDCFIIFIFIFTHKWLLVHAKMFLNWLMIIPYMIHLWTKLRFLGPLIQINRMQVLLFMNFLHGSLNILVKLLSKKLYIILKKQQKRTWTYVVSIKKKWYYYIINLHMYLNIIYICRYIIYIKKMIRTLWAQPMKHKYLSTGVHGSIRWS